jgi:trans-aconitate methyltransferase
MDLREALGTDQRHPWELARVLLMERLLNPLTTEHARVLDIGAGDGFAVRQLSRAFAWNQVVALDSELSPEQQAAFSSPEVRFEKNLDNVPGRFDLLLLLDVLEHVEQPLPFLKGFVTDRLERGGVALVTVPAFQSLYCQHDRDLLHHRRYRRSEIQAVAVEAGLKVERSGYFFSSLLLPRALTVLRERLLPPQKVENAVGVGGWHASPAVTRALTWALATDGALGLKAPDFGLTLPGLSAWLICRKPY